MSNHWDIACVDCGEELGLSINHRDDLMRDLITHRVTWEAMAVPLASVCGEIHLGYGATLDLEFFEKHKGHCLRPVDECGRHDTPCGQQVRCRRCGVVGVCWDREHPKWDRHLHACEGVSSVSEADAVSLPRTGGFL